MSQPDRTSALPRGARMIVRPDGKVVHRVGIIMQLWPTRRKCLPKDLWKDRTSSLMPRPQAGGHVCGQARSSSLNKWGDSTELLCALERSAAGPSKLDLSKPKRKHG